MAYFGGVFVGLTVVQLLPLLAGGGFRLVPDFYLLAVWLNFVTVPGIVALLSALALSLLAGLRSRRLSLAVSFGVGALAGSGLLLVFLEGLLSGA